MVKKFVMCSLCNIKYVFRFHQVRRNQMKKSYAPSYYDDIMRNTEVGENNAFTHFLQCFIM